MHFVVTPSRHSGCRPLCRHAKIAITAAVMGVAVVLVPVPVSATEPSQAPKTQTIRPYGSNITVQRQEHGVRLGSVLDAIGKSKTTAQDVKILSKLDGARVIDIDKAFTGKQRARIRKAVEAHRDDVKELDLALEGNALTYAALKAQSVIPANIVGAVLSNGKRTTVTIYVAVEGH